MRRAAPTAGLSPRLIKHFAIATVSITALLALFASDADWGAQAQYEEVEAKNRLAAAEAEKLGTKKVKAKLKVRKGTGSGMSGGGGSDFGSGSGGGGSLYPEPPMPETNFSQQVQAGATNRQDPRPGPPRAGEQKAPAKKRKPTEAELEAMLEASRLRSGSSGFGD